ncbi:MAG: hypothetical protein AB2814_07975 [Candidatus Sedimenticola endophacoides]
MNKKRLLERLRKTRSTGKTLVIEKWPEIKEALRAGFEKKDIHAELEKDGLQLSYAQFARLTKELADDDEKIDSQAQHSAPVSDKIAKVEASPRPAVRKESAKPTIEKEPPKGNAKNGDRRRFDYDPKPDEDELI